MKHYGDIQKIDGHKVPLVDIITAGSPCQDLSIAKSKRDGLSGERSGLFMEAIRIIKEMHDESRRTNQSVRPRLFIWENVTGALSSNDGEDFRVVLEEVCRIVDPDSDVPRLAEGQTWSGVGCILGDGWSVAWKIHDSQFWGVPQRRRRLCLVGDFRGESAPEILFERKSLSGDSEQSGEERGESSPDAQNGIGGTDRNGKETPILTIEPSFFRVGENISVPLKAKDYKDPQLILLTEDHFGEYNESAVSASLRYSGGSLGGGSKSVVVQQKTIGSSWDGTQKLPTLTRENADGSQRMPDKSNFMAVISPMVRRITPLEAERLQGFPDNWTNIGKTWTDTNGKKHKLTDAPRYKALGNSIAVGYANNRQGFWCWLADRMVEQLKADGVEEPTMASLFDGIGGFPLAYQSAGCRPIWASEIEEFPIAVTKYHFPEEEERKN